MKIYYINGHEHAQVKVIVEETGTVRLISYVTEVITVENGIMNVHGLYSMTTRKHISWFLREWYPRISYQSMKYAYEHDALIDVVTGQYIYEEDFKG